MVLTGARPEGLGVGLVETTLGRTVIEYSLGSFERRSVEIDGLSYDVISLDGESNIMLPGMPSLPNVVRSLVIPDDAEMSVRVVDSHYVDIPGVRVAPSKGVLTRDVDPSSVPYVFEAFYAGDAWYPSEIAYAREPYIIRDVRGLAVVVNPFQYNPAIETLRVYDRLVVEVEASGPGKTNVLERRPSPSVSSEFRAIYDSHFLNYGSIAGLRYSPVEETGSMLIICFDGFMADMQPFVEWKRQMGIACEMVAMSDVGIYATDVRDYIQTYYDTEGVTFVLLVGDSPQVPTLYWSGGASDPSYSLVAGDDSYPDILVGRFSAATTAGVATQVLRTVEYEKFPQPDASWYHKGTGIASNQGPGDDGEDDDEHVHVIRDSLLGYTYTVVDEIYDPGATPGMVSTALNDGRGIVNYTGHGSTISWSSSDFTIDHVNALTNDNKLPFIVSVACYNGAFTTGTCFAEAWLQATNGSEPTGALVTYMSSISQSWDPPMCAQDEIVRLLINEEKRTFGGLCMNGSCQMIDEYGTDGANMFKTWHVFGDPSVHVRTDTPADLTVSHDAILNPAAESFEVSVPGVEGALCAIYYDGVLYGSALTDASGNATVPVLATPPSQVDLTLTVTAMNRIPYFGAVTSADVYVPVIQVSPSYVEVAAHPGETLFEPLYIENTGEPESVLHYALEIVEAPGPRDFTGSGVAARPTYYAPGEAAQVMFSVYNGSSSGERIGELTFDFPSGAEVVTCTDFSVSERLLSWDFTTGDGVSVNWAGDATNVIYPYETATATVGLSVDAGFTGDLEIAYTLEMNPNGGTPHGDVGTVVLIPRSTPGITVMIPNGGEVWGVGESHEIAWDWSGTIEVVSISCSTDSGSTWSTITPSTENDGVFQWTVDAGLSEECLIKIASVSGPAVEDTSDGTFCVYQPVSWLTAMPTSGDVPSGEADAVALDFDTTGLPEGNHYADILIDSNGGDRVIVPIVLAVQTTGTGDVSSVSLYGNYPNPFGPGTTIAFALAEDERVRVSVYNLSGRLVRTLTDRVFDAGPHEISWDGTDGEGLRMASGIYLYRLEAAGRTLGGKLVLTR